MASQQIPVSYDPLVELLEDAADGARDHGVTIGLKQNTETGIRADLETLAGTSASPGSKALWNTAKANKVAATATLRSVRSNGRAVASACVGVLKPRLGNPWNNAWQTAGFTTGSLEIPENPMTLLQQLRAYFVANPAHEKPDLAPGIAATAAACDAAAQAISDASTASNQSNTDAGTAKKNLENDITVGRKRLTGLREELAQLIDDDDERWYAFGFDKPGDPQTPDVPENLTGVAGSSGSGILFGDWDDARRAESYRATVSNVATNAKIAEKLTTESETTFSGLPLNAALKLTVTAINKAGESQPSDLLTITLP